MSRRQREAAQTFREKHGDEAAAEMLALMGFTDQQIARAFMPVPAQPDQGSVVRFTALGTYRYAAIRMGAYWYVTSDGDRRSTALPKMTWDALLEWGGPQLIETLEVMVPNSQSVSPFEFDRLSAHNRFLQNKVDIALGSLAGAITPPEGKSRTDYAIEILQAGDR
jgi:hypothetical protein